MAQDQSLDTVEVRITIAARPETVFSYLRDPAAFQRWMGAASSISPAVGGAVRVAYPNGDAAVGTIEELVANQRVVLRWGYESGPSEVPADSTRVEITLTAVEGGTRVVLRHSGLATAAQRRNHRAGWRHHLAALAQLATAALDPLVERALDAYVAAWGAGEERERRQLLEGCWHPGGVFRDAMGYVEGLDDLVEYIGLAQGFMPGVRLVRDGAPARSQGFVSHRWRLVQPDGATVMAGSNTVEFGGDGLIRAVTGFWGG